jgi:hypothetical protein
MRIFFEKKNCFFYYIADNQLNILQYGIRNQKTRHILLYPFF